MVDLKRQACCFKLRLLIRMYSIVVKMFLGDFSRLFLSQQLHGEEGRVPVEADLNLIELEYLVDLSGQGLSDFKLRQVELK
jgi:hypothetical protein